MTEPTKANACTTTQRYNGDGNKVTQASCPFSEATYTDGSSPTLTLSGYGANSAGGIDEKAKTELTFKPKELRVFSKTDSGKETVRFTSANYVTALIDIASVYCNPSFATTGYLFVDRLWEDTKNANEPVAKSILADQVQQYAKQHPQVVQEILKAKPVIAVSLSGNFTLEEAFAMKAPQFAACPSDPQSKKEGIVIQKRVRD